MEAEYLTYRDNRLVTSQVMQRPVIDRIRFASDTFERTTGKKPVSIYLGYMEWVDLKSSDWARQQYIGTRDFRKPMADGKRVYVVTQDSHLAVA